MPSIRLDKKTKTIKVVNRKENIRLQHTKTNNVRLQHTGKVGPTGAQGIQGEQGAGLPAGGTEGQFLAKDSSDDYDYLWYTPSFTGDKTYTENFYTTNEIVVNHGLSKYPAVTVFDSAGDEVVGSVYYQSLSSVIIRFSNPFSGTVSCN